MRFLPIALTSLLLLTACGGSSSSPTSPSVDLTGTWTGSITSPEGGTCNIPITVAISQSGNRASGSFAMPSNSSGSFEGTVSGDSFGGTFTTSFPGCVGVGDFSGTRSGNRLTLSAPVVTSPTRGCRFCQNNTIVLSR